MGETRERDLDAFGTIINQTKSKCQAQGISGKNFPVAVRKGGCHLGEIPVENFVRSGTEGSWVHLSSCCLLGDETSATSHTWSEKRDLNQEGLFKSSEEPRPCGQAEKNWCLLLMTVEGRERTAEENKNSSNYRMLMA